MLLAFVGAWLVGCPGAAARRLAEARCDPQPPCPAQLAVVVRVRAAGRPGPVPDAFVTVREAGGARELQTLRCRPEADASVCRIPGGPGAYDLVAGAPGFDRPTARVAVADTTAGACCPSLATQQLTIPLAAVRREQ